MQVDRRRRSAVARPALLIMLIMLIMLASGGLTLAGVNVDFDPKADFDAYHTYAWRTGTRAVRAEAQLRIEIAVDREMGARGYRKVESSPDVYVQTHALGTDEIEASMLFPQAPTWWRYGLPLQLRDWTKGTLVVKVIDAGSDKPVFVGIGSDSMTDASQNTQALQKKIYRVVRKMFKSYPERASD